MDAQTKNEIIVEINIGLLRLSPQERHKVGHGAVKLQCQIVCAQERLPWHTEEQNVVKQFRAFLLLNAYCINK